MAIKETEAALQAQYQLYREKFGDLPNFERIPSIEALRSAHQLVMGDVSKRPNAFSLMSFAVSLTTVYMSKYWLDTGQPHHPSYNPESRFRENLISFNETTERLLCEARLSLFTRALGRKVIALSESVFLLPTGATEKEMTEVAGNIWQTIQSESIRLSGS